MSKPATESLIEFLSNIPIFSEVNKESLKHLSIVLEEETFRKNKLVFEKDSIGEYMYIIVSGSVKVHEKDHVFGHMHAGECFGEYALIDNNKRSAFITTLEDTTVLKINREHFFKLISNDIGFSQGILSVLIKRHRNIDIIQENLASSKKALEIANSKLSGLINGAMDGIIMFDEKFRILLTNPSANVLFENNDVIQRNLLFFLDDSSADRIQNLIKNDLNNDQPLSSNYLPDIIKVIGSNETETLNEGTISKWGDNTASFYTLILRNIQDRLQAEDKIEFLTSQTEYLKEEIKELTSDHGIIAEDQSMKKVMQLINKVAGTHATVLINGETGTGKELVARAIHQLSDRKDKPLIRINCGAIPTNLIESELFGHEKGAFTGATTTRKGRFLLADKGTIFLDEIGELPLDLQPKLLRVIQEGEFDAVGSSETIQADVRIIAATHRDLMQHVKDKKFREDLFYRLNVFPITVPPLRDRGNDICLITNHMISEFSRELNRPINLLSEDDKTALINYNWPGNVRELQNLIERAIIISQNNTISWQSIIPQGGIEQEVTTLQTSNTIYTAPELIEIEKANIERALKHTKWKISGENGAAKLLKLPPTTLSSRIKALGIERPI
ncbi:sigma 54-interacting transcriptional regulator [Hanstruepera ponticola]|uniref:sigma 54-interacting transcriptional regulator n=1 Tax=Hanstruepera ponticola TaxID=2042995 RepID=UPI000CF0D408|nr:sigma 54-interacting transcriptional regulator [Hanstruepera ponticola]